jgi:hypothetical protein
VASYVVHSLSVDECVIGRIGGAGGRNRSSRAEGGGPLTALRRMRPETIGRKRVFCYLPERSNPARASATAWMVVFSRKWTTASRAGLQMA